MRVPRPGRYTNIYFLKMRLKHWGKKSNRSRDPWIGCNKNIKTKPKTGKHHSEHGFSSRRYWRSSSSSLFVAPFVFGIFVKSHLKTLQHIHFSPRGLHAQPKDRIPNTGYPCKGLLSLCLCDFGCALHWTPSFRFALVFYFLFLSFFYTRCPHLP